MSRNLHQELSLRGTVRFPAERLEAGLEAGKIDTLEDEGQGAVQGKFPAHMNRYFEAESRDEHHAAAILPVNQYALTGPIGVLQQ